MLALVKCIREFLQVKVASFEDKSNGNLHDLAALSMLELMPQTGSWTASRSGSQDCGEHH